MHRFFVLPAKTTTPPCQEFLGGISNIGFPVYEERRHGWLQVVQNTSPKEDRWRAELTQKRQASKRREQYQGKADDDSEKVNGQLPALASGRQQILSVDNI